MICEDKMKRCEGTIVGDVEGTNSWSQIKPIKHRYIVQRYKSIFYILWQVVNSEITSNIRIIAGFLRYDLKLKKMKLC